MGLIGFQLYEEGEIEQYMIFEHAGASALPMTRRLLRLRSPMRWAMHFGTKAMQLRRVER